MAKNKTNVLEFLFKRKPVLIILLVTALIVLMIIFIFYAYSRHKDIVVQQQKQHLLSIAETIARNLEHFVEEKLQITDMYFDAIADQVDKAKNPKDMLAEAVDKFYAAQSDYMDSVYIVSGGDRIVYRKGIEDDYYLPSEITALKGPLISSIVEQGQAAPGPVFIGSGKYFLLSLIKPVFTADQGQRFILCTINLNKIYDDFIAPTKVGERGYILVKDSCRRIIMYRAKEQVGLDVIKGRQEKYPDLYYRDLENLVGRQMTGEPGTAVYYSYWWTERDIQKVKKISAFTPIRIGKDFWVISVQMDFKEVQTPVKNNLNNILLFSFLIFVILSSSIYVIMRLIKNTETLEIETKYLKELQKTSEELQKSERKAKHYQRLQTIGTLTGGIAHEFNNLLTPIIGYCEILLKNTPQDSDLAEDIGEIYRIARKAEELVKQILGYGRLDPGFHVFKPLHISSHVKESVAMMKKILPPSIEFVEKINSDCGYIYANATMINQIIVNLCTNAYQAMKGTKGTLMIELEKVKKEDLNESLEWDFDQEIYIMLRVTDTGCGMDEETRERIFDPFFTTKEVGEGTGLGLWLVQSIAVEHKGEVFVHSEQGKGSVFSVYLPWMGQEAPEEQFDESCIKRRDNLHVLFVDDEADTVKVFKKGLTQMGYMVCGETDPISAISKFKVNPDKYDVIITDYVMPKINGLELAEIVKNVRENVKIILITGFMEKNGKEIVGKHRIDGFLTKPLSCFDLDVKIQTLFWGTP